MPRRQEERFDRSGRGSTKDRFLDLALERADNVETMLDSIRCATYQDNHDEILDCDRSIRNSNS